MTVLTEAKTYPWSEYTLPSGAKAYAVYGVPFFAPAGAEDRDDLEGHDFGTDWMGKAAETFQRRKADNYWSPVHLGHQDQNNPTDNRPFAGFLDNVRKSFMQFEGEQQDVLVGDLVDIPPTVFQEIRSGAWPYRSIEIRPPYEEVSSLALLSTIPPHHKFGVLALDSQGTGTAMFSVGMRLSRQPADVSAVQFSQARSRWAVEFAGGQCDASSHMRLGVRDDDKDIAMSDTDKDSKQPPFPFSDEEPEEDTEQYEDDGEDEDVQMMDDEGEDGEEVEEDEKEPTKKFQGEFPKEEDEKKKPVIEPEDEMAPEGEVIEGEEGGDEPEVMDDSAPPDEGVMPEPEGGIPQEGAMPPAAPAAPATDPKVELMITGIMASLTQIAQAVGVNATTAQPAATDTSPPVEGAAQPLPDTVNPVATLQEVSEMETKQFAEIRAENKKIRQEMDQLRRENLESKWVSRVKSDVVQLAQEGRAIDVASTEASLLDYAREGGNAVYSMRLKELRETHPEGERPHRAMTFAQRGATPGVSIPRTLAKFHKELGPTSAAFQFAAERHDSLVQMGKTDPTKIEEEITKALNVRHLVAISESGVLTPTAKGR